MKEHSLSLIKDSNLLLMRDLADLSISSYPEVMILLLHVSVLDIILYC